MDPFRDTFVIDEMNRVADTFGNHPSINMFFIGNELGKSDFNVIKKWVTNLKDKDNRRLYSLSTARKIIEVDEYMDTHDIQGVGRTSGLNGSRTNWDFEHVYSQMGLPKIAHEIVNRPTISNSKGENTLNFDTRITKGERVVRKIRADEFFRLKEGEFIVSADSKDKKVRFPKPNFVQGLPEAKIQIGDGAIKENFERIHLEVRKFLTLE